MIPGSDVAGAVIAVGPNVTRFGEGDRVLGHGVGLFLKELKGCVFQAHTVLRTNMACKIPDGVSFEGAAVIPLGFFLSCMCAVPGQLFEPAADNGPIPEANRKGTLNLGWSVKSG